MIPWSHSPPDEHHNVALAFITQMAHMDRDLGVSTAQMEWVIDGITPLEKGSLRYLIQLANDDLALVKDVMTWPWVVNPKESEKSLGLKYLVTMVRYGPEMAQLFVRFAEPYDEITQEVSDGFYAIVLLASTNVELTKVILWESWVFDGMTVYESNAVRSLATLAEIDPDLARSVIDLAWVSDGLSGLESGIIYSLTGIIQRDLELGRNLFNSIDLSKVKETKSKERYLLITLHRLRPPELFDHLIEQPWFTDGLDQEETAFIAALYGVNPQSRHGTFLETYKTFIETYYTQSSSVDLPLSGTTDIWIFKNTPFYPNQDFVKLAEELTQSAEEVLGIPIPTADILSLIVDSHDEEPIHPSYFTGISAVLGFRGDGFPERLAYHELGHMYFNHSRYFNWVKEGIPEFLAKYALVRDESFTWSQMRESTELTAFDCMKFIGAANLRELVIYDRQQSGQISSCNYSFGSYFFIRLFELLGRERFASSTTDIDRTFKDPVAWETFFESTIPDNHEEMLDSYVQNVIHQGFLNNTPPQLMNDFVELYEELHGPVADNGAGG